MESRIRILFLIMLGSQISPGLAADNATGQDDKSLNQVIQQEPLIQPSIARREVKEAAIAKKDFELGAFVGLLSIEDFGTNAVYGVRMDYHISEDLFLQASFGLSEAGRTSADNFLGGASILSADQKEYTFYDVSLGYNLFPGESFIGGEKAFNTALYLIAGAGSTKFGGDDRFTINIGGGYRVILSELLTLHLDFRDHIFSIDVTGENKDAHNFEMSMGLNFIF